MNRLSTYEQNLACRIQRERQRRGWSYDALARAVTQAGCPMHPATPFKIIKGKPQRRATIDELVAFSKVFDLSLDELLGTSEIEEEVVVMDPSKVATTLSLIATQLKWIADTLEKDDD